MARLDRLAQMAHVAVEVSSSVMAIVRAAAADRWRSSSMMVAGRRPITSTRSDRNAASRMLWVTKITVLRLACQMRSSSTPISSRVMASSALNGSSISRMRGIVDERPADRHALAHAARELARQQAGEFVELAPCAATPARAARYCARGSFSSSIGKQHVVEHRAPRQQHRALEDDADLAARPRHRLAVDR